jgi:hypothetical protein
MDDEIERLKELDREERAEWLRQLRERNEREMAELNEDLERRKAALDVEPLHYSEPRFTARDPEPEIQRNTNTTIAWTQFIDQRIADAIERERDLQREVLAEFFAHERHAIEGQIKDAKLQMIEKMLDTVRDIRKAVEPVVDLPPWRDVKAVN